MSSTVPTACDLSLVEPFVQAAGEVFETMLGSYCRSGEIQKVGTRNHQHAVTAVVGLSWVIE